MTTIAVLGGGGIGSYYAALLDRAGHEVRLLTRGAHLDAVRTLGLAVRSPAGDFLARPRGTDDPEQLAGATLALVAVKSYALAEIAPAVCLVAGAGATVVPLLNGVDIADRLIALGVPRQSILGGLVHISVARIAPGVVARASTWERLVVGALEPGQATAADRVAELLRGAGSEALASDDIGLQLWRKFLKIVPMTVACGLSRRSMGPAIQTERGRELLARSVAEIGAVCRASGGRLDADDEARALGDLLTVAPEIKPSFLLDLERGGETELDVLAGTVSRLGALHGVPTPVHDVATWALSIASFNEARSAGAPGGSASAD